MVFDPLVTYKPLWTTDNKFLVCCADRLLPDRMTRPHIDLIFALRAFFVYASRTFGTFAFAQITQAHLKQKPKSQILQRNIIVNLRQISIIFEHINHFSNEKSNFYYFMLHGWQCENASANILRGRFGLY